jgi:hypothetical protein
VLESFDNAQMYHLFTCREAVESSCKCRERSQSRAVAIRRPLGRAGFIMFVGGSNGYEAKIGWALEAAFTVKEGIARMH